MLFQIDETWCKIRNVYIPSNYFFKIIVKINAVSVDFYQLFFCCAERKCICIKIIANRENKTTRVDLGHSRYNMLPYLLFKLETVIEKKNEI